MNLLKLLLTKERVFGLVQHGLQWLAALLVVKHWLGEPTSEWIGAGMSVAAVLWSAFTGGKDNFWQVAAGGIRHILSMLAAIAVFKGWVDTPTANYIIGAILGLSGLGWSIGTPEKTEATRLRHLDNGIIKRP